MWVNLDLVGCIFSPSSGLTPPSLKLVNLKNIYHTVGKYVIVILNLHANSYLQYFVVVFLFGLRLTSQSTMFQSCRYIRFPGLNLY